MIASFRHLGLKALYEGRTSRRVAPEHVGKLRDFLGALDFIWRPVGTNLPGFRLHSLKGPLKVHYADCVPGNWHVTVRSGGETTVDVDYVDYH